MVEWFIDCLIDGFNDLCIFLFKEVNGECNKFEQYNEDCIENIDECYIVYAVQW